MFVGEESANNGAGIITIGARGGYYGVQRLDKIFLTITVTQVNCVTVTV
jgi:hypothetical protein